MDPLDFLIDKPGETPPPEKKVEEVTPPDKEKKKEETPPPAPKAKEKEEQLRTVAKQRDEYKAKMEELEKKAKELEEKGKEGVPKSLKAVEEYLKKKFGVEEVDEETVNKFIEHNKKRKTELEATKNLSKRQEEILKDVDIEKSYEFNTEFRQPLVTQSQALFAEISTVDNEGQVKHGPLFEGLYKNLLSLNKDGSPLTSIQVKGVLQKFSREYMDKTGEDYEVPNLVGLVNSIASVHKRMAAFNGAKQNWATVKKESEEKRRIQEVESAKKLIEADTYERTVILNKFIGEFDYDKLDGAVEREKIETAIKEIHANVLEKVNGRPGKQISYGEFLDTYAKASCFDDLVEQITKLKAENKSLVDKGKGGLGLKSVVTTDKTKPAYIPPKGGQSDPTDFLKG
jgi:hypothetical protein